MLLNTITPNAPLAHQRPITTDEINLEQVLGVSLLGEYNDQLTQIANELLTAQQERQTIQSDIDKLEVLAQQEPISFNNETYIAIDEAYLDLFSVDQLTEIDGQTCVIQDNLESLIQNKNLTLASLHSQNEVSSIKIQSLMDQRKQTLTILSNLLASKNDMMMTLARNMKI